MRFAKNDKLKRIQKRATMNSVSRDIFRVLREGKWLKTEKRTIEFLKGGLKLW